MLAAFAASLAVCFPGLAFADGEGPAAAAPASTTWYIVGGPEETTSGYGERLAIGPRGNRVDFGVTLSRLSPRDAIAFTSGATSPLTEGTDGYAFLVSGAYDFGTGTLVTPRIVGGVGVSYLGTEVAGVAQTDPTQCREVAPTAHIGFGADFDLGDTLALSAEYRAMYLGETDREGRLGESRLDQKFPVGAKIRF